MIEKKKNVKEERKCYGKFMHKKNAYKKNWNDIRREKKF